MDQRKYIFQKDSLRFSIYRKNWKRRLSRYISLSLFAATTGILSYFASAAMHMTTDEIRLRSRNRELKKQYDLLALKLEEMSERLRSIEQKDDSLYRSLLGMDPLSPSIRKAGTGGHAEGSSDISNLIPETRAMTENLESRLNVAEKSLDELWAHARKNQERMLHLPAIIPVSRKDFMYIVSGFGMRMHPILKIRRMHEGFDFVAPYGSDVYATADGKIASTRISGTFGNIVEIDHGFGYKTLYAHLKGFHAVKGQTVQRGDLIGWVGNTGLSAGTHLHYEVHLNGKAVDPSGYFYKDLTPAQYEELLKRAAFTEFSLD